jgi:hypothetical protein
LAIVTADHEAQVKAAFEEAGAWVLAGPMDTTGLMVGEGA